MRCGATRLVYTSTYDVVFRGQEIRNGDQSLPYLPLDKVEYLIYCRVILTIHCVYGFRMEFSNVQHCVCIMQHLVQNTSYVLTFAHSKQACSPMVEH